LTHRFALIEGALDSPVCTGVASVILDTVWDHVAIPSIRQTLARLLCPLVYFPYPTLGKIRVAGLIFPELVSAHRARKLTVLTSPCTKASILNWCDNGEM
jgi:hypothetical protein